MGDFFYYASFPNSRIKPRPSTSVAYTAQVDVPTASAGLVVPSDANRTYMTLENFDAANAFFYVYATTVTTNPTTTARFGVENEIVKFGGTFYQKQTSGVGTDWNAVNVVDVGEKVLALQVASLDSPQEVWAQFENADGVIGIDVGAG